jgi:hypothetical protein
LLINSLMYWKFVENCEDEQIEINFDFLKILFLDLDFTKLDFLLGYLLIFI